MSRIQRSTYDTSCNCVVELRDDGSSSWRQRGGSFVCHPLKLRALGRTASGGP